MKAATSQKETLESLARQAFSSLVHYDPSDNISVTRTGCYYGSELSFDVVYRSNIYAKRDAIKLNVNLTTGQINGRLYTRAETLMPDLVEGTKQFISSIGLSLKPV